jgi:very-short-patch-repair endonuclease
VAARQWSTITTAQLRAIGFSKGAIAWMVRQGLLTRLHRGVFIFGAPSRAPEQRWAAALLATGDGSALDRTAAAAFHGHMVAREVIDVVAPTRRRGDDRLRLRTAKRFEVIERRGIRVTTPAQTLLDLAAAKWPIDRMTHEFAASGLVSLDDLRTFARNRRGEPGATALARALNLPHTRSSWEREFLRWVQELEGVEAPRMNDRVGHLTVDCHWPDHDLVIELDSEQTHGTAWKQRDDAARDDHLEGRGKEVWRVRREEWERVALGARLRERLDSASPAGAQLH